MQVDINKTSWGMLYAVYLFGIMASILSACASQTTIPISTQTSTNIPTQRPFETSTPFPTLTPRPTLTIAPTSTLDNIAALASEFDVPAVCLFTGRYLVSKDQNWIGTDCKQNRELIIVDKLSREKITVSYKELDEETPENFSTRPLSWSSDNRYFYFTTRCCDHDDSYNSNGSLYQLDLEKESWRILVHAVYEPFYFFSNDGEQYVFLNHSPLDSSNSPDHLEIGMVDLLSNKNKRVVFRHLWGPLYDELIFAWSKNNDKFAIVLYRPTFHPHEVTFNKEMLILDFNKMNMELVEEFNRNNLFGEN